MVTSLRMKPELEKRYTELAIKTGRSKAFYFSRALENAIDQMEFEYGILDDLERYRAGKLETYTLDEVRKHCELDD